MAVCGAAGPGWWLRLGQQPPMPARVSDLNEGSADQSRSSLLCSHHRPHMSHVKLPVAPPTHACFMPSYPHTGRLPCLEWPVLPTTQMMPTSPLRVS